MSPEPSAMSQELTAWSHASRAGVPSPQSWGHLHTLESQALCTHGCPDKASWDHGHTLQNLGTGAPPGCPDEGAGCHAQHHSPSRALGLGTACGEGSVAGGHRQHQ